MTELGQHFLIDSWVIERIVDAIPKNNDSIIEVGSGMGQMTKVLLQKYKHVHAIEYDKRFISHLNTISPNISVYQQDVKTFNIGFLSQKKNDTVLCGNLPYYISKSFFYYLFRQRQYIHSAVFVVQKEFGERLMASVNDSLYGPLSVLFSICSKKIVCLFEIPPSCFDPPPKVVSVAIKIDINPYITPKYSDDVLFNIIKKAFSKRRKKLRNIFESSYVLSMVDLNFDMRARQWDATCYEKMAKYITNSHSIS